MTPANNCSTPCRRDRSAGSILRPAIEGRWGGIITGDKITVDFGTCACGHQGPTVGREISVIPTSGWRQDQLRRHIDAYVRGVHDTVGAALRRGQRWSRATRSSSLARSRRRFRDAQDRPRSDRAPALQVPPLLNVPLAEIIDFLVETGRANQRSEQPFHAGLHRSHVRHAYPAARCARELK